MTASEYRFLTPPGWYSLQVLDTGDASILGYVDALLADLPPERRARARGPIVARIREVRTSLASVGVHECVLPTLVIEGWVPQASFTFRPWRVDAGQDPVDLLIGLAASDPSAELRDVSGLVALRTTEDTFVDPVRLENYGVSLLKEAREGDEQAPVATTPGQLLSRRVRYFVGAPDDRVAWLESEFTCLHSDAEGSVELTEVLAELYDIVIQSVRFA